MPSNASTNTNPSSDVSSSNTSTIASLFRAKTLEMKTWKPRNVPSSRDRLELYSLHKQAVSGDAPLSVPNSATSTNAQDMAKYNAWKTKRGLSKYDAMNLYIQECDRQVRTYGTLGQHTEQQQESTTTPGNPQTPTNTPSAEQSTEQGAGGSRSRGGASTNTSTSTTPRGLAAVPLLCAAATETRKAYLSRLHGTSSFTNEGSGGVGGGWWSKQEPLSVDNPLSLVAVPERFLIQIGQWVELLSLYVQSPTSIVKEYAPFVSPSVLQALLWPLHNMILALWVYLIICYTTCRSVTSILHTLTFGSRATGIPLEAIYHEDIVQTKDLCDSMTDPHQALSVRLVGLALWPYNTFVLQTVTLWMIDMLGIGLLPSLVVYCLLTITCTWWYWLFALPTMAIWSMGISLGIGLGYGLIELAGM